MTNISSEFNKCCSNPATCIDTTYLCDIKKKFLEELSERDGMADYMLPGGVNKMPFELNSTEAGPGDQTIFSSETLLDAPQRVGMSPADELRAKFRARAAEATERANSPEARTNDSLRRARSQSRSRDFGMDM